MVSVRAPLIATILAALTVAVSVPVCGAGPSARELYRRGRQLEKSGHLSQAYLLYSQAAVANPNHPQYWQRAMALQTRAVTDANVTPTNVTLSSSSPAAIPEVSDPGELEKFSNQELAQARRLQPPIELLAAGGHKDFALRADSKILWEQVAKAYGIDVIFDGDYQASAVMRFDVGDAGFREAFHSLMAATGSFLVPLSPRLVMVVKDTEPKRREVENTVTVTIPIPNAISLQDAQEMARSVQQLMEIQRFAIDTGQRAAMIRDRISKVVPAQALFQQLLSHRAQIAIEVDIITVPKTVALRLGLSLPSTYSIIPLVQTISLSGGALPFGLVLGAAELLASWSKSSGKTILRAEMRSLDGVAASFHAGEKYPIATLTYGTGQAAGGDPGYTPPPVFNFEDLGLGLKVTPKVHDKEEVTLDIEAEYKLLGTLSQGGNPIISSRKFANRVRLRFNQPAIIAGLVSSGESTSLSGLAGLMTVPVLRTILGRTSRDREESETMVILTPRLLSLPASETPTREIWIGSESRLRTPL